MMCGRGCVNTKWEGEVRKRGAPLENRHYSVVSCVGGGRGEEWGEHA